MANDAYTQQALAKDSRFLLRLGNALSKVAWEILEENPTTEYHKERAAYAQKVTGSGVSVGSGPSMMASQLAPSFVNRPNVFNFDTTYDFTADAVITAAGDPDIENQLHTDWNMLAGVVVEPVVPEGGLK